MKTLIHLTFHRNFFIAVISESDCATIENLRSCPKFGRNRTSTHEWTQTRTGAGPGHWPAIDVIIRHWRVCR
ncbi:hypothetical protein D4U42_20530, partial [Escherichia coli]|nr:hypothetical protein [Escherichia coli]